MAVNRLLLVLIALTLWRVLRKPIKDNWRWIGDRRARLLRDIDWLLIAGDAEKAYALALAHPAAHGRLGKDFWSAEDSRTNSVALLRMRPVLLHTLGIRDNKDLSVVRDSLSNKLRADWYRLDLTGLDPQDDPKAALAFACARVCFSVRLARLLDLVDDEIQWMVLLQNAGRARSCFDDWEDYGTNWARGRRQWLERSRDDSLGRPFDESQVSLWITDADHPWHVLRWETGQLPIPKVSPTETKPDVRHLNN